MNSDLIKQYSEEYVDYLRDESRTVGHADYIAFPKTEEEVIEVVKYCYDNNIQITSQGSRTGVAAGAVPYKGLALNFSKMNQLVSKREEGGEVYLTFQPGAMLMDIRTFVHDNYPAYFFPPDPTETSAAIGGMVNCNSSGALSFMYGPTRNHVTRLTYILSDGRKVDIKRGQYFAKGLEAKIPCTDGSALEFTLPSYTMPNTKNVAGYFVKPDMDLFDLTIGCDGTLAILTSVEIKLQKLPKYIAGAICMFETEDQAFDFVIKYRYSKKGIAALEYFDSHGIELLRYNKANVSGFEDIFDIPEHINAVIYTEIHAMDDDHYEDLVMNLSDYFMEAGGREDDVFIAEGAKEIQTMKDFRHAMPESSNMQVDLVRKLHPEVTKMGGDMSVPDEYLMEAGHMFRDTIKEWGFKSATWAHIGQSHIHANIIAQDENEYARAHELFKEWARWVSAHHGSVSAEHGIGKMKNDFLMIMYGQDGINQMRNLKKVFDTKYLLNVGNLFSKE